MTSLAQRASVYVIDDDDAVRDSIRMMLECEGFTVYVYASCVAFLREAHPQGNCCVVVDVHMPGMGGLELVDQLRRDGITIPAIVITGKLDARIARAVDDAGAILLEKPLGIGELVDRIERVLGREQE